MTAITQFGTNTNYERIYLVDREIAKEILQKIKNKKDSISDKTFEEVTKEYNISKSYEEEIFIHLFYLLFDKAISKDVLKLKFQNRDFQSSKKLMAAYKFIEFSSGEKTDKSIRVVVDVFCNLELDACWNLIDELSLIYKKVPLEVINILKAVDLECQKNIFKLLKEIDLKNLLEISTYPHLSFLLKSLIICTPEEISVSKALTFYSSLYQRSKDCEWRTYSALSKISKECVYEIVKRLANQQVTNEMADILDAISLLEKSEQMKYINSTVQLFTSLPLQEDRSYLLKAFETFPEFLRGVRFSRMALLFDNKLNLLKLSQVINALSHNTYNFQLVELTNESCRNIAEDIQRIADFVFTPSVSIQKNLVTVREDLKNFNLDNWKNLIHLIAQNSSVWEGDIRENLKNLQNKNRKGLKTCIIC